MFVHAQDAVSPESRPLAQDAVSQSLACLKMLCPQSLQRVTQTEQMPVSAVQRAHLASGDYPIFVPGAHFLPFSCLEPNRCPTHNTNLRGRNRNLVAAEGRASAPCNSRILGRGICVQLGHSNWGHSTLSGTFRGSGTSAARHTPRGLTCSAEEGRRVTHWCLCPGFSVPSRRRSDGSPGKRRGLFTPTRWPWST